MLTYLYLFKTTRFTEVIKFRHGKAFAVPTVIRLQQVHIINPIFHHRLCLHLLNSPYAFPIPGPGGPIGNHHHCHGQTYHQCPKHLQNKSKAVTKISNVQRITIHIGLDIHTDLSKTSIFIL